MGLRKANAEKFDREVLKIAKGLGARLHVAKTEIMGQDVYTIETKAGLMTINPSTRPKLGKQEAVFTVFCRFYDVDQAKALGLPYCNPHSGKYNLHECGHDADVAHALESFRQHLQRVVA